MPLLVYPKCRAVPNCRLSPTSVLFLSNFWSEATLHGPQTTQKPEHSALLTAKILEVCHESSARHRQGLDFLDPATGSLPWEINAATDDAATGSIADGLAPHRETCDTATQERIQR
jgi:hypothetical protein